MVTQEQKIPRKSDEVEGKDAKFLFVAEVSVTFSLNSISDTKIVENQFFGCFS